MRTGDTPEARPITYHDSYCTNLTLNPPTLEERPAIRAAAQELLAKVEA